MVTSNGSSPLTMGGLDPGMMYSVTINVFDGNQVVLSNQTVTKTVTVMDDESGKYMWISYTMCHEGLMGKRMCINVRPTYVNYAQNLAQNAFWNFPNFNQILCSLSSWSYCRLRLLGTCAYLVRNMCLVFPSMR